jgi:hypothetical protein
MMPHEKKVKDKRIEVTGESVYLATVEYYRDTPARDVDVDVKLVCEGLAEARKFLASYPRDFWEDPGMSDRNYKEIDDRRRRGFKTSARADVPNLQKVCAGDRKVRNVGRTFARLRGGD